MKRSIAFYALYISASISAVEPLKDLCIKDVLRKHYDYDSVPSFVGKEISDREKQLNHNLYRKIISSRSEPYEICALLKEGADPDNPRYGTLLEYVTENGYRRNLNYNRPYSDGEQRATKIARHLITYGARFTLSCLFNAVKNSNKDMFALLQKNYFPKTKTQAVQYWHPDGKGCWRVYEERTSDDWKGMTNECERNIFHHCAVYSHENDFVRWLFENHAKWKFVLAKDRWGDTVLDLLRNQHNKGKKDIACQLTQCAHCHMFPVKWEEQLVEKGADALDWIATSEPVDTAIYNVKRLLGWH